MPLPIMRLGVKEKGEKTGASVEPLGAIWLEKRKIASQLLPEAPGDRGRSPGRHRGAARLARHLCST